MVGPRARKYLKWFAKLALSALALYLVFRRIDVDQTMRILGSANPLWLFLALIFFNISKIASALRLNRFFRATALRMGDYLNMRLYYVGMFYNLFLPGGVGGDGYKLLYLKRKFGHSARTLFQALLYDRINGLAVLVFLSLILLEISGLYDRLQLTQVIWWVVILAFFPAFYLFTHLLFKAYLVEFYRSVMLSFGVQLAQLICALLILLGLGAEQSYIAYLLLFLLSSIATIIPVTIGGIGIRELVMVWTAKYAGIDEKTAVALGLMFFLITAISSFAGVFVKLEKRGG